MSFILFVLEILPAGDLLPLIALSLIFYTIFRISILFNKVFTFGEAVAMAQLIGLFSIDAVRDIFFHINQSTESSNGTSSSWKSSREEADIVIYVLLLSILGIGMVLSPLIKRLGAQSNPITVLTSDHTHQKTRRQAHSINNSNYLLILFI